MATGPEPVGVARAAPARRGATGPPIDWGALRGAADAAASRAYAPYSGLKVGAAGLCTDGRVFSGCNVENASYGLTLCAECGLISELVRNGPAHLVAISVTAGDGKALAPCGRCRQLLMEHGGPGLLVDAGADGEPHRLEQLLPGAFHSGDLARAAVREPGRRQRGTGKGEGAP
ncbi:MAG TPA: cytidine deaminase [Acidimicrobiales bacterium]|nr:cytidine deaminase [Acidimicrobiales bacterium]